MCMTQERRRTKLRHAKLRNVVNIKTSIFKEMINKLYAFGACDSTCHECISEDEVDNYKIDIVVEKEDIFKKTG